MKKTNLILLVFFASISVWGQTKISDGTLKASVTGAEKIPVSGSGHPVINTNLIFTYQKARMDSIYATSASLLNKLPVYNVKAYGAVGDGKQTFDATTTGSST